MPTIIEGEYTVISTTVTVLDAREIYANSGPGTVGVGLPSNLQRGVVYADDYEINKQTFKDVFGFRARYAVVGAMLLLSSCCIGSYLLFNHVLK